MKRIALLLSWFVLSFASFAQETGSVRVEQDARIENLLRKQLEVHAIDSASNGYRIHIFMEIGNEALTHAEEVRKRFEETFPEIPIYLSYSEPYFRLRAGDFRNRVEAQQCLLRVKHVFGEAFVIADVILQPKLKLPEISETTEP